MVTEHVHINDCGIHFFVAHEVFEQQFGSDVATFRSSSRMLKVHASDFVVQVGGTLIKNRYSMEELISKALGIKEVL